MEITAGSLLARSLNTLTKNFGVFVVISLIFQVPNILVSYLASASLSPTAAGVVSNIASSLFGAMVAGGVLFGVVESLRGGKADVGKCIQVALSRFVPIFLVSLLYGIGVGIGLVLLIVPGVILLCVWYVAIPVTVVEQPGVIKAFGRSAELTKGHRVTLFITLLVFIGISIAVSYLLLAPMLAKGGNEMVVLLISLGMALTLGLWSQVAMGVAYHDLRVKKEGITTEQIAEIFA
jgi:hypothetical protein